MRNRPVALSYLGIRSSVLVGRDDTVFGTRTGAARSLIDMQTGGAKAVGKTGAVRPGEGNGAVSKSWKPAETWHPKPLGNASNSSKVCAYFLHLSMLGTL